jgi:hypothetical protein
MFNNIDGVTTIRKLLEEEIDKSFGFLLRNCLHDEHFGFHSQFDYVWQPRRGSPNVTISMKRRALYIDL